MSTDVGLALQQMEAKNLFDHWYNNKNSDQIFRLYGSAGTGKTYTAKTLSQNKNVVFCAYTGKAASVMNRSGCHGASTIHSLIYKPVVHDNGKVDFIYDRKSRAKYADLIIVDECSMVDEKIANDLMAFNKKILVIGDPQQLPPVNGHGVFTDAEPDYLLTEIHRQALNSPITLLATAAIQGEKIEYGTYGDSCRVVSDVTDQDLLNADMIIVGKNDTRHAINKKVRKLLGKTSPYPEVGERLICLKNNKQYHIYNGQTFVVTAILNSSNTNFLKYRVKAEDNSYHHFETTVHKCFFDSSIKMPFWAALQGSNQFDYAYALTAHKCQGDQSKNVIVLDESYIARENRHKFLYTAITRASETLILVT